MFISGFLLLYNNTTYEIITMKCNFTIRNLYKLFKLHIINIIIEIICYI